MLAIEVEYLTGVAYAADDGGENEDDHGGVCEQRTQLRHLKAIRKEESGFTLLPAFHLVAGATEASLQSLDIDSALDAQTVRRLVEVAIGHALARARDR